MGSGQIYGIKLSNYLYFGDMQLTTTRYPLLHD